MPDGKQELANSFGSLMPYIIYANNANKEQFLFRFPNGYGASVVRGLNVCNNVFGMLVGTPHTYGAEQGLFELAVIRFNGPGVWDWYIDYTTPITSDVVGRLSTQGVSELLYKIKNL